MRRAFPRWADSTTETHRQPQQWSSLRGQDALRHALSNSGKCTGPKTEAGKTAIRASRTKHGRYSHMAIAERRETRALLRRMRELLGRA
jgi:hypothetical protein